MFALMEENKYNVGDSIKIEYHFDNAYYDAFIIENNWPSEIFTYKVYFIDKQFGNNINWPQGNEVQCHKRMLLIEKKQKLGDKYLWLNQM